MKKRNILISIELEEGQVASLQLSPRSYKQSFRDFKLKYKLDQHQAFKIKNLIQSKLIQIADHAVTHLYHTPQRKINKQDGIDSPRFRKIVNDQQIQTDFVFPKQIKQEQLLQFETEQRHEIEQMPLTPVKAIQKQQIKSNKTQRSKKTKIKIAEPFFHDQRSKIKDSRLSSTPPLFEQEKNGDQKEWSPLKNHFLQQEYDIPEYQNNETQKKEGERRKQKMPSTKRSPNKQITFISDRLYYNSTDSFRSKKNEQINRKQLIDYLEVEKYELSNRLKRTTNAFFCQLHNRTTASWEHKVTPEKQKSCSPEDKIHYSDKKVPLSMAFKGSLWKSRMRCEAKQYENRKNAEEEFRKKQQNRIRKRMSEEQKNIQNKGNKQGIKKSRVCAKCSPQKEQKPGDNISRLRQIGIKRKAKNHQKQKYMSDILLQAYQQRCQMTQQIQFR